MNTKVKFVKKSGILIFLLSFSITIVSQPEFVQHQITTSFVKGFDVIVNDLDLDGDIDIIGCAGTTTGEVSWWENNSYNQFTKHVIKSGFNGARSVRASDVNNDGYIDIVSAGVTANTIVYFENDGNQNFSEQIVDNNFIGAHTIDLKDVNNDGQLDIMCSGFDYYGHEGEIAWWSNDGQDPVNWTKNLISERFQQSPFIYGEDMDNDSDIDIIACGELNNEVLWWENDGNQHFTEHMIDDSFNAAHTVIARDVDMDGDLDIIGSACISSKIAWYENNGAQQFTKHDMGTFGGALWLDAADLDNDGDQDLYGAGMSANYLAMWENDGNQNFTKINIGNVFTQGFCVVPAMMDNDDDIDLVSIGYQNNSISWFENRLESPNLLNNPESVVFDSINDRYLVSNCGNGKLIQIDKEGNQSYFNTSLEFSVGLHIVDDVVYVSSNEGIYSGIVGFSLSDNDMVFHVEIPEKGLLNDISSDNNGNLYVTDSDSNKIYRLDIDDENYTTFVDYGLGYPNGIYFHEASNSLWVLNCLLENRPILAIDLEGHISTLAETGLNAIDGLTTDNIGNVYFSSWSTDKVYRYNSSFSNDPEVISSGHTDPADIYFNCKDNVLAIPNFNSNSVDFKSFSPEISMQPENDTVCESSFTSLQIESDNTDSFQWQIDTGNGFVDITDDEIYTGSNTIILIIDNISLDMSNYYYRCTLMNGYGGTISNVVNLQVLPSPDEFIIAGETQVIPGQEEVYTVPENIYLNYTWLVENGNITEQSLNYSITISWGNSNSGLVSAIAENEFLCLSDTVRKEISITTFNDEVFVNENKYNIYPNPATDYICIRPYNFDKIQFFDIIGHIALISEKSIIDISALRPGIYILKISDRKDKTIAFKRILIR